MSPTHTSARTHEAKSLAFSPSAGANGAAFLQPAAAAARPSEATGNERLDLGLVALTIGQHEAVFRFSGEDPLVLEIPGTLMAQLLAIIRDRIEGIRGKKLVFDFENTRAISSRQLGIAIMIRTVCAPLGSVWLRGLSPGVRRVLTVGKLVDSFQIEPGVES